MIQLNETKWNVKEICKFLGNYGWKLLLTDLFVSSRKRNECEIIFYKFIS